MREHLNKSFKNMKRNFELQDRSTTLVQIAKVLVIVFVILNLSYSQIHIATISQIFNRLIGLVMFMFILLGMVSLFAVTRIGNTSLFAVVSVGFNVWIGEIYILMLLNDVLTQEVITMATILPSFVFSVVIVLFFVLSIILFILGETNEKDA